MPNDLTSISFPASPALNDTYTYGNQTYQWNGTEWVVSYDSNSIPIGAVTLSGNQTITGVKTFSNNIIANSQLLIGSSTIIPNPTIPLGYKLEITVENSNNSLGIYSFGASDANVVRLYGAQGTKASPTAAIAGQTLGGLRGFGYNGSAWTPSNVGVNLFASENFTTTAQGTYITLSTTNHGSTTLTEKLRILHNGNVGINTTSPSEKLEVNGTIKATNLVVSGTVVNVVQTALTSNHTISPSSYSGGVWGSNFAEFSTNYRANITPKSSINKILIEVNCHIGTGYWSYGGKVQASTDGGTTWVDIGTAAAFAAGNTTPGNYYSAGFGGNYYGGGITQDSYHLCNTSYKFLHSPNTTNNIIYRVVFKGYNTYSLRINRTVYDDIPSSSTDYYPATISTITLTEIVG